MAALGFGIDIGGSGIKGAVVDLGTGDLAGERLRIATPRPATPEAVTEVVVEIVQTFDWTGPVGITLPSVVKQGVALSAANIDRAWLGTDVAELFTKALGRDTEDLVVLNDADAAGIAEIRLGDPRLRSGVVVLLTFGTGIGSAVFIDGTLLPNTEFGHLEVDGVIGELRASAAARENEGLSFAEWADRVSRYLDALKRVLWPDLIVVGGGVSKKADRWVPLITGRTPIVVASLRNHAGIVGAALTACDPA